MGWIQSSDIEYLLILYRLHYILKDEKEKRRIEPLPPVDHSLIQYPPFKKRFYKESAEISALTDSEVQSIRKELQVSVSMSASAAIASGFADCPKPIQAESLHL